MAGLAGSIPTAPSPLIAVIGALTKDLSVEVGNAPAENAEVRLRPGEFLQALIVLVRERVRVGIQALVDQSVAEIIRASVDRNC